MTETKTGDLAAALDSIRKRHSRYVNPYIDPASVPGRCSCCRAEYPCDAVRLAEALEAVCKLIAEWQRKADALSAG